MDVFSSLPKDPSCQTTDANALEGFWDRARPECLSKNWLLKRCQTLGTWYSAESVVTSLSFAL